MLIYTYLAPERPEKPEKRDKYLYTPMFFARNSLSVSYSMYREAMCFKLSKTNHSLCAWVTSKTKPKQTYKIVFQLQFVSVWSCDKLNHCITISCLSYRSTILSSLSARVQINVEDAWYTNNFESSPQKRLGYCVYGVMSNFSTATTSTSSASTTTITITNE